MNAIPEPVSAPLASFDALTRGLEERGFVVQPGGLPPDVARVLASYAVDADAFHAAAVGRGVEQQRNRFVRRDLIHWMDERDPAH